MKIELCPEQESMIVAESLLDAYENAEELVDSESKYDEEKLRKAIKVILSVYMSAQEYKAWKATK